MEIEDAAAETRIPKKFLEALEQNAPIDTYPAPVYARAFLREYARFLGVDPEPLVPSFGGPEPVGEFKLASIREVVPPPRRWPSRVLLGLSICILSALAVIGVLSGRARMPAAGPVPEHPVAAGPTTPAAPPPTTGAVAPPAPVRGIRVAMRISDRCWVVAAVDGRQVFRGILVSGQSRAFHARSSIELTLGNAAGAQLVVNGTRITTGPQGQVLRLSLSLQHGRVHVTRV